MSETTNNMMYDTAIYDRKNCTALNKRKVKYADWNLNGCSGQGTTHTPYIPYLHYIRLELRKAFDSIYIFKKIRCLIQQTIWCTAQLCLKKSGIYWLKLWPCTAYITICILCQIRLDKSVRKYREKKKIFKTIYNRINCTALNKRKVGYADWNLNGV